MLRNPLFWLSLALHFVSYLAYTFLSGLQTGTFPWFTDAGDTTEYFCYGESLLLGQYNCDGALFTRMPAYPALYAIIRVVFDPMITRLVMVLIQVAAGGIATFMLTCIASNRIRAGIKPWLMVVFFSTAWILRSWDNFLLTESLAASVLVAGIYFGMMYDKGNINLLLSGLFFTICVFLRPFSILLMGCFGAYLLYKWYAAGRRVNAIVMSLLVWMIPFIIFESAWVTRNYHASGRLIPLQASGRYPGIEDVPATDVVSYNKVWDWIRAVGEDCLFWNPGSLGSWMYGGPFKPDTYHYKPHLMADSYGVAEIEKLRVLYEMQLTSSDPMQRDSIIRSLVTLAEQMTIAYKKERPFQYYVISPLRILSRSLVHTGPSPLFHSYPEILSHPVHLVIKLYSIFTYWLILCCGTWVIFRYFRRNHEITILSCMALSLILFFGIFLRYTEFRLYFLVFPLLAMLSTLLMGNVLNYFANRTGWTWVRFISEVGSEKTRPV